MRWYEKIYVYPATIALLLFGVEFIMLFGGVMFLGLPIVDVYDLLASPVFHIVALCIVLGMMFWHGWFSKSRRD